MKILIVEDDFISRRVLQKILSQYGECEIAVNGTEAVEAFSMAIQEGVPYNLVCLDIMMPELNGQEVLKMMRQMEKELGVLEPQECMIIMTTALDSPKNVIEAYYHGGCTDYMVKPIDKNALIAKLKEHGLIE